MELINNTTTIKKVVQAINDRDLTVAMESVTDGFTRHDLADAFAVEKIGGAEVNNFLQTVLKAFPDIYIDIQDIFACDDRVVMRYQFAGTHKGELFGIPASGKKVNFCGINIYRFENGKIAEVWQLWDWAGVLRQIDAINIEKFRN